MQSLGGGAKFTATPDLFLQRTALLAHFNTYCIWKVGKKQFPQSFVGNIYSYSKKFGSTQHMISLHPRLLICSLVEGTLKPHGDKTRSRGPTGPPLVLLRAGPWMAQPVPFQGDVRTLVPVRAAWRRRCHFMVPSSDLFIESNKRKSMSMTFVVHLSILAQ